MMVSVIVPALNEVENIQECLAAARRAYTPEAVEIIVVDGGSHDGTPDHVPPGASLIASPRGRAVQMNAGARTSRGDILSFCHADSRLPSGWREAVIQALDRPGVIGGTFQTSILPAYHPLLRLRNRRRFPANWRMMYGDQVQFMRRETFLEIGGFPEIVLMEDVEMSRALHGRGELVRLPLRVATSSRRFRERGLVRQTVENFVRMVWYLYLGASPEKIARTYRSRREEAV